MPKRDAVYRNAVMDWLAGSATRMLFLLAVLAPAVEPLGAQPAPAADDLGWMGGCWERRSGELLTEEHWMRPAGGMLLGMSRTVRGARLVEFEAIRIYEDASRLVYAASPSGQDPAEFRSTRIDSRVAEFSNPAHDFPQVIRYRAVGADSMVARIEGTSGGKVRGVDFRMRRVPCP